MRTLGRKIIELDPPQGFAAETTGAAIMFTTAYLFKAPVSTTHVITSAIMGVGATKRVNAVRWGVAKNIVLGWFITIAGGGDRGGVLILGGRPGLPVGRGCAPWPLGFPPTHPFAVGWEGAVEAGRMGRGC